MKKKQIGVAIVEFALVLPLLLILTFITTEFSRALYQYNTIVKSVRNAARYLSMQDPNIKISDPGKKITIAKNLAVYGLPKPAASHPPLTIGLDISNIPDSNIQWNTYGSSPLINTVTIKVTGYKFKPLLCIAFTVNFGCDAQGYISYGTISATMRSPS